MSQHTRLFLTVLSCAVCVAALLVIVSACVEPVGPFDNAYDPDNPDSPFSYDISAVSGTGSVTTTTAAAEVTFEWSSVDYATMYHLQVARDGAFSDMVHDDELVSAGTTAVVVDLETGSRYFWRVRYEAEVTHNGTTSESWGLWYGPWEVTVRSEDSGDGDDDEIPIMVEVPGGTFNANGTNVTISAFRMSQYEITQAQYQAVMGSNPSSFTGDTSRPVEEVSWYDAIVFCNMLSMMEGRTPVYTIDSSIDPADWGTVPTLQDATWDAATMDVNADGYRLPTEAEWEYAAKGGEPVEGYTYAGSDTIDDVAWYNGNSGDTTHPVGQKQPNRLGLYDMSGNVWEWTWDWEGTYPSGTTDPTGAVSGPYRVTRGGSWLSDAFYCTVANRLNDYPNLRFDYIGFRVVRP